MEVSLDEIELAFVANLATLREVLKKLSVNGKRWWIASDPADSLESRFLTIGHGDPGCVDRLNTLYYRVPILNEEKSVAGADKLVLLLDSSVVLPEQRGFYLEDGRVVNDDFADLEYFFFPIKRGLTEMLRNE
jgi:hypothetical protein